MFEACFGVLNGISLVQVSVAHVVVDVGTACFCDDVVLFQSQCSSSLKTCTTNNEEWMFHWHGTFFMLLQSCSMKCHKLMNIPPHPPT